MDRKLPIKFELPDDFYEEEIRCDYKVSQEMKSVWAVELDLLEELKRVCKKYSLNLYAEGGTVLGAVRHGGFIPWDDDIDLGMMRRDYEKLCEVAEDEFSHPYFWQTEETDPGVVRGHGQLRNSETAVISSEDFIKGHNAGIFIDVFPLDTITDDATERHALLRELHKYQRRTITEQHIKQGINTSQGIKKMVKDVLISINRLFNKKYRNRNYEKAEKLKQQYRNKKTGKIANLFLVLPNNPDRWVYDNAWFSDAKEIAFETTTIHVPAGYEEYLNHCYGNWREYVVGGSIHGNLKFDPYNPYTKYSQ